MPPLISTPQQTTTNSQNGITVELGPEVIRIEDHDTPGSGERRVEFRRGSVTLVYSRSPQMSLDPPSPPLETDASVPRSVPTLENNGNTHHEDFDDTAMNDSSSASGVPTGPGINVGYLCVMGPVQSLIARIANHVRFEYASAAR